MFCCIEGRLSTGRTAFRASVAGQFLTELERHAEAAAQYVRAVELAPAQYDLVLSAATALRHAGNKQRAERFYRRAAELKPQVQITCDMHGVESRTRTCPLFKGECILIGRFHLVEWRAQIRSTSASPGFVHTEKPDTEEFHSHLASPLAWTLFNCLILLDTERLDRLCGLMVRVPGYTTEMYCASCQSQSQSNFTTDGQSVSTSW
jgi:tetratricopeptide (TPR) repeat protein